MKLSIEIDNDYMKYDYEVGASKQTASMALTEDMFVLLAEILQRLHITVRKINKDKWEKLENEAINFWIKKNKDEAVE